jgi:hypothetical protein
MTLASNGKDKKGSFLSNLFGGKKKDENKNIQLNIKKEEQSSSNMESMTQSVINSFMSATNPNNGINNTISASITPDLLNNIDLNKNQTSSVSNVSNGANKKDDGQTGTNIPLQQKSTQKHSSHINQASKIKNPLSRLSLGSSRLASESIDYEPVFK